MAKYEQLRDELLQFGAEPIYLDDEVDLDSLFISNQDENEPKDKENNEEKKAKKSPIEVKEKPKKIKFASKSYLNFIRIAKAINKTIYEQHLETAVEGISRINDGEEVSKEVEKSLKKLVKLDTRMRRLDFFEKSERLIVSASPAKVKLKHIYAERIKTVYNYFLNPIVDMNQRTNIRDKDAVIDDYASVLQMVKDGDTALAKDKLEGLRYGKALDSAPVEVKVEPQPSIDPLTLPDEPQSFVDTPTLPDEPQPFIDTPTFSATEKDDSDKVEHNSQYFEDDFDFKDFFSRLSSDKTVPTASPQHEHISQTDEIERLNARIQELESANKTLTGKVSVLIHERDYLRQRQEKEEENNKISNETVAENETLKAQVSSLTQERDTLQGELDSSKKREKFLTISNDSLSSELNRAKTSYQELQVTVALERKQKETALGDARKWHEQWNRLVERVEPVLRYFDRVNLQAAGENRTFESTSDVVSSDNPNYDYHSEYQTGDISSEISENTSIKK